MTVQAELKSILAVVTANTAALAGLGQSVSALAQAVAAIPAQPGSASPDLTPINEALEAIKDGQDKILSATSDIQSQLEVDDTPTTQTLASTPTKPAAA